MTHEAPPTDETKRPPASAGEMAHRIRAHDWAATPLGPIDTWPQSLKTTVDIVLACGFPAAALWGPELVQIYNDAYRDLLDGGHPDGLGRPARFGAPVLWHAHERVVERVLAGETVERGDAYHVPARTGDLPGAWFSLSYCPLRDESGRTVGVLVTAVETTERVRTEAELREREERFRALATASSYVVYRMSPDWSIMRELDGSGFLSATEHPSDEWLGQYIHPDDQPLVTAAIGEAIRTRSIFELEHRVRRADGSFGWTLSRAVPLVDANGEITEWIGAASDVTARREAQEELAETRRRLESALIAGEVGTFEWDVTRDRLWGDRNFARMFGITLDPDGAAPLADYVAAIHPDDHDEVLRRVARTVEDGCDYEAEYRIISGGETRWIIARGKGERDESGRVVRFPGAVLDVTERKLAEDELRRSNSLVYAISDSTEDVIFAKDRDGRLTFANPATLALIGKPLDQVLGKTDAEILNDAQAARDVMHNDARIMAAGVAEDVEEIVPLPDGTRRVWFSRKMPYRGASGRVVGLLGVSRDITDRKLAEAERERLLERESEMRAQAEAANRAKDEFLATVSHELRTPLNAMLGWSTMLRSGALDEATRATAVAVIDRNVRAQAQIIEDLLDVSRIISGKLRLDARLVDPGDVVNAAAESMRPAAEAKGIRLRVLLDPDASPVLADPERLQQVVWNLVSNAVKFTAAGGSVDLRLEQDGTDARIVVSDTGNGIEREFLPYVFDRFRQADQSTTRTHGGLGLGLSIVRHLVELHGGTVAVDSEGRGMGTTFTVVLPRASAHTVREPRAPRPVPESKGASPLDDDRLSGVRVLAIDDEPDTRDLLVQVFAQCGAEVLALSSVDEALARIEAFGPDVIVSDIGMPGRDGYDLIRAIRALGPDRGGRVPAVALTAYARVEERARAIEAGYQVHAPKPIEPAELVTIVADLSGRS